MESMRVTVDVLGAGSAIPVRDAGGDKVCTLWSHAASWPCRDALLEFRILGPEPLSLPLLEPSEPTVGALARLQQAIKGSGAIIILVNPATAFGRQRILYADGARLFAITTPEDEACWDALLATGQPVYGIRGIANMEIMRATAPAVISALAYGLFTCDEGLSLTGLHEDRAGIAYACERATEVTVIIRGGFEAEILRGEAGAQVVRKDRGNEAVVRLVISDVDGNRCSTQPRFVVPSAGTAGRA